METTSPFDDFMTDNWHELDDVFLECAASGTVMAVDELQRGHSAMTSTVVQHNIPVLTTTTNQQLAACPQPIDSTHLEAASHGSRASFMALPEKHSSLADSTPQQYAISPGSTNLLPPAVAVTDKPPPSQVLSHDCPHNLPAPAAGAGAPQPSTVSAKRTAAVDASPIGSIYAKPDWFKSRKDLSSSACGGIGKSRSKRSSHLHVLLINGGGDGLHASSGCNITATDMLKALRYVDAQAQAEVRAARERRRQRMRGLLKAYGMQLLQTAGAVFDEVQHLDKETQADSTPAAGNAPATRGMFA